MQFLFWAGARSLSSSKSASRQDGYCDAPQFFIDIIEKSVRHPGAAAAPLAKERSRFFWTSDHLLRDDRAACF